MSDPTGFITVEELESLNVGDSFAAGKPLPGLNDVEVAWELIEKSSGCQSTTFTFVAAYMGTPLQAYTAVLFEGSVTWRAL